MTVKLFRAAADPKIPFPLKGSLLNGFRPSRVIGPDTVEFPHAAVKHGRNVFSIGPQRGCHVRGCAITLSPR
ncbi:MAG: hypothetical protein IKO72_01345 [Kiritimatiellae bacterium]|nr:hypothetical protein [Kiritimatiellia bacterium]